MEKELANLEELTAEATRFALGLAPKDGAATLVTLSGELGAGKTSFSQGAARALGVTEAVTSPTFVLEKEYALERGAFERLVHIDAYRLKEGSELGALGFKERLADPANLILLEWPERVADALPVPDVAITLAVSPSGGRTIAYAAH
ncbi:MAG TPA: tRNA (adenosine(37)-N6)-threonylcarbamoyltransferase complex ATPase subunit type 1 TsaE [Candidatus Paceibacterota bacterium]|nr:tRNA (adenosine(37)-N6)-threonylcarbamoyltransferase complex ATPase subunit type 1 TsaE [Candidatus Paceibacterota bacterium]